MLKEKVSIRMIDPMDNAITAPFNTIAFANVPISRNRFRDADLETGECMLTQYLSQSRHFRSSTGLAAVRPTLIKPLGA